LRGEAIAEKPAEIVYLETMETATLVPVEEYLRTHYDPDCEYVDGRIVERTGGDLETQDPAISLPIAELFE